MYENYTASHKISSWWKMHDGMSHTQAVIIKILFNITRDLNSGQMQEGSSQLLSIVNIYKRFFYNWRWNWTQSTFWLVLFSIFVFDENDMTVELK